MAPKYEIGQKVIITPVNDERLSPRDSSLEPYAGKIGTISNYYWVDRDTDTFYIYSVQIEEYDKAIVLHEDELKASTAKLLKNFYP